MLKSSDSKIGVRECSAMIITIIYTKITDDTVTNFFNIGKNSGWMVPLVSALTLLLPICCVLCLVKRYEDKGLIEIIYNLTGKYIGFFIGYTLFILNIIIILVNLRDNCNTINTLFYPRTDVKILVFSLIGTSCFIAMLGLKASARTCWLMLLYIELSLIVLMVLSTKLMVPYFLLPIGGNGIKNIVGGGIANGSLFQVVILLSICYPMFRNYKSFKTASLIGLLASTIKLCLICIVFEMIFDYPAVGVVSFPLYTALRLITITRFISNLEALLLLPSVIAQVMYYSIYIYLTTAILTYTLKIKKIEPLIIPVASLIAILAFIPENSIMLSAWANKMVTPTLTGFLIIIPLIFLAISQLKGDYKK